MKLKLGYAYRLRTNDEEPVPWTKATSSNWIVVVCKPYGPEVYLGSTVIDARECVVFDCGRRGILAQPIPDPPPEKDPKQ